jgi:beta-lactam-binding protein with PASTA domain/transcriptional regulator with XRE-family HTH domain
MEAEIKVGGVLRAARESKGLSLAQAEKATRIRQKYIEALEEDRTADLPEPVFVKGFLRNYAILLGLNAQEVIDRWRNEHGVKKEAADVHTEIEPLRTPSRLTPAMLTLVLALIVFSIVMYYLYQQYAAPPVTATPTILLNIPTPTPTPTIAAADQTPIATRVPTPSAQDVAVPDIAGMALQEADDALRALGLRIEVLDRQYSQTAAAGIVLSQTVRAQTKVQKESVIGVTLSRGSQAVAVPRLVGLTYNDAVARLAALGLRYERLPVSAQGTPNAVVGQDPIENTQVAPNSVVRLTVSVGDMVTVPKVRGMPLEQAKDTILKAGLIIGQVSFQGKEIGVPASQLAEVCVGCVLSTDPWEGTAVQRNKVINIGVRRE